MMSEAVEAVAKMLDAFPNARDGVRKGYIGVLAELLTRYPRQTALRCAHPIDGVIRDCKFLPTVAEAVKWLEREVQSLRNAAVWDARARDQLIERERFEREDKAEPLEHRKAVAERMKATLRAAGFKFAGDRPSTASIDAARAQLEERLMRNLGIAQQDASAMLAAMPDAPDKGDYWQGVRWPTPDQTRGQA